MNYEYNNFLFYHANSNLQCEYVGWHAALHVLVEVLGRNVLAHTRSGSVDRLVLTCNAGEKLLHHLETCHIVSQYLVIISTISTSRIISYVVIHCDRVLVACCQHTRIVQVVEIGHLQQIIIIVIFSHYCKRTLYVTIIK